MISTKRYVNVSGSATRFLSDFIIRSESHVRVYAYVYTPTCTGSGTCDTLTTGGLYIRLLDAPQNNDLMSVNLWDLVDNSIIFYTAPEAGATVVIEVATTPEEFGDAIAQPIVIAAQSSADAAAVSAAAALVSENNAATSETNAALSAASVTSSNIIHIQGGGGGDPEGYTDTELNAGQLDTRYYTETEIDTNIYTKTQIDIAVADRRKQYAKEKLPIVMVDGTNVLTAIQNENGFYELSGTLTADAILQIDITLVRDIILLNSTTGGFKVTVQGATGTGVVLDNGQSATLYSDGTNVEFMQISGTVIGGVTIIDTTDTADAVLTNLSTTYVTKESSTKSKLIVRLVIPTAISTSSTAPASFCAGLVQVKEDTIAKIDARYGGMNMATSYGSVVGEYAKVNHTKAQSIAYATNIAGISASSLTNTAKGTISPITFEIQEVLL